MTIHRFFVFDSVPGVKWIVGWWSSAGRCVYMDRCVTMLLTHLIMRSPPHGGGNGWGQYEGRMAYRFKYRKLTYLWCHGRGVYYSSWKEWEFFRKKIDLGVGSLNKDSFHVDLSFFSLIITQLFSSAHTSLKCNNLDVKLLEDAPHFWSVMSETDLIRSRKWYADSAHPSFRITSWFTYFMRN